MDTLRWATGAFVFIEQRMYAARTDVAVEQRELIMFPGERTTKIVHISNDAQLHLAACVANTINVKMIKVGKIDNAAH